LFERKGYFSKVVTTIRVVEHVVRGEKFVQADFSRHEIVEVHSSPFTQAQGDRDVAGEVGGAEICTLDPDLIQDSGDDGDLDGGQGSVVPTRNSAPPTASIAKSCS
jgi:hypothetical protein